MSSGVISSSPASSSPIQLAEPEFVSAFQVLGQASNSNRFKFQGHDTDCSKEPRAPTPKNRPRGTQEEKQFVINAVPFDSTGPVTVTLWGNVCRVFL